MQRLTFKSRLALWFSSILALCLFIAGVVFVLIYLSLNLITLERFMLREGEEIIDKHLIVKDNKIYFLRDDQDKTLAAYLRDEGLSSLIIDRDGNAIGIYGIYRGIQDTRPEEALVDKEDLKKVLQKNSPRFKLQKLYEGRTYLVVTTPLYGEEGVVGFMVLSSDVDIGNQMMVFTIILLLTIMPASFFIGWLATKRIIGDSFAPLERILSHMKHTQLGTLSKKIKIKGNPEDELVRLSVSYNEMLRRINEGVTKQKEFISNTSHELKTPLARAVLELETATSDLKKKRIAAALDTINATKRELKDFGDLINGLLSIANLKKSPKIKKISVISLTEKIIDQYSAKAKEKGLKIKLSSPKKTQFTILPEHFKIILGNLLSNAIKYSHPKDNIRLTLGRLAQEGFLEVENVGEYLDKLDLRQLVKRFYRPTSSIKEDGHGIGLSVVKDIVHFYKLEMTITSDPSGRYKVRISGFS